MENSAFESAYTTINKIGADIEGKENKKTIISEDAFAIGTLLQELIKSNERLRLAQFQKR